MRSVGQCCPGHLSAKSRFLIMLEEWEPIGLSLTVSLYVSSNLASNSPLGMGSIQCKGSCTFSISHKPFLHSLTRGSDCSWYHYYMFHSTSLYIIILSQLFLSKIRRIFHTKRFP